MHWIHEHRIYIWSRWRRNSESDFELMVNYGATADPPKRLQPSIISRTKLMANVSLAEKRVPLDGRINVKVGEKSIDLRVSTFPTVHGESIVMRILDKESLSLGSSPAWVSFRMIRPLSKSVIALPDGIFLGDRTNWFG